jgi:excinuclease UvrABC nuclease subunit
MADQNQGKLLDVDNPLQERLGKSFFDELPRLPGVYKMYSHSGQLLYVGKAKDLRTRLFSYRRAKNHNASKKVRRLVCMVHAIEYECCASEEEALLRENHLIREHQPGFNVAKKQPNTYYYLSVVPDTSKLTFDLSMMLGPGKENALVYGAFKGHHNVRQGLGALLRQLYLLEHNVTTVFEFPGVLLRNLTPLRYNLRASDGTRLTLSDRLLAELHMFLEGTSLELMSSLVQMAGERMLLQDFIGRMILKDYESLKKFYDRCTHRNHRLAETLSLPSGLIPQHKLDDYLVQAAFANK